MENKEGQTQGTESTDSRSDSGYTVYDLFILAISILSLIVLVIYYLPAVSKTETGIALILDTLFSIIFLFDFFHSLIKAPDRKEYFLKKGGWLDLLGSIPFISIFRILRIARAFRIIRRVRKKDIWSIYKQNKGESVFWSSVLITILLLTVISLLIVRVEAPAPDAQITTTSDALWWSLVTVTTVGYGDLVPVTNAGRFLAATLMTVGVAFISVITSYITTHLVLRGDPMQEARMQRLDEGIKQLNERYAEIERVLHELEDKLLD